MDAATLIIIDREGPTPKVLMGRRHAGHKFMPGKFVFPGGRIEPATGPCRWPAPSIPGRAGADGAGHAALGAARPRLALAAIRETFEETGLLLGTKEHGAPGPACRPALVGVPGARRVPRS